ncbi:MAG: hypothetical protein ACE5KG_05080, partial [Nitrososphaerales archaeon]
MSQYDADALMAYFKKHQISRRTAVVGGAVVVIAGASGAYLAFQPGGQPDQMEPKPTTPTTPSTPGAPAPSRPSAPAPSRPAPAPAPAPSPAPQERKRVIVALQEDMNTLFPLAYPPGGAGPHRTVANFQETLLNENRTNFVKGGPVVKTAILAANPNAVAPPPGSRPGDWTRIRIQLRPNVRFHSGAKLTSESLSGPFDFQQVYDNSNWSFYYPTRRGGMTTEIVDDLTADMVWARGNLNNLEGFRHPGRPFIWNPAWIEEHGLESRGQNLGGADQDGAGPFKVKE